VAHRKRRTPAVHAGYGKAAGTSSEAHSRKGSWCCQGGGEPSSAVPARRHNVAALPRGRNLTSRPTKKKNTQNRIVTSGQHRRLWTVAQVRESEAVSVYSETEYRITVVFRNYAAARDGELTCKDNTYPKLVQVRPSRHHAGMVRQRESSLTTGGATGVVMREEEL
jgi:hypothetical protein